MVPQGWRSSMLLPALPAAPRLAHEALAVQAARRNCAARCRAVRGAVDWACGGAAPA